jgi:hypothetical protein
MHSTIILNVRGIKYEVNLEKFSKYPNTRLGMLRDQLRRHNLEGISNLCDRFDIELQQFYFDRDPYVLNKILGLYLNGKLHLNTTIECGSFIASELKYWMIELGHIDTCCRFILSEKLEETNEIEKSNLKIIERLNHKNDFGKGSIAELREKLWLMFEKPKSSKCAKVFIFLLYFKILLFFNYNFLLSIRLRHYL